MEEIGFKIAGQTFAPPLEWEATEVVIDWTKDREELQISIDEMTFVKDASKFLNDWKNGGLTGQYPGVYEGVPFEMNVSNSTNSLKAFDGYIDLSTAKFLGCEQVVAKIDKVHSKDWLSQNAEGFSFASLYAEGIVTNADFHKVAYVINYVPDTTQVITLIISGYILVKETIENIKRLADAITDLIQASTPNIGVPPSIDLGDIIAAVLKVLLTIVIIALLLIAVINLIKALMEQFFPKKRYHLGMKYKRMFEVGCQKLGLTFDSSIFTGKWANAVYIPRKDAVGGTTGERGFPTSSEQAYDFAGFVRLMKLKFNADYRIENGVFKFERRDYWKQFANYTIPNTYNDQSKTRTRISYNADELNSNFFISFSTDIQDQNTLDSFKGTNYQIITEPINEQNRKYRNIRGFERVDLPLSFGKRKDTLTSFEKALRDIARLADKVTGIFGNGTSYASKIDGRKGAMNLSSHFISTPKCVIVTGDKLASNQRELLSAKAIWNEFYFINSFVAINNTHNQHTLIDSQDIPFCFENLLTLINNNFAKTQDGKDAEIERLRWRLRSNKATIDYRINELHTNNLKLKFNEGG